jgi:site-specific DNA-cytosine methylase
LFDGVSCGQLALRRAGITYDKYYASEVNKHAIKVTQANWSDTIQLGDVTQVTGNRVDNIDLLLGGSPCQGFSFAGKMLNFDDPRSKLFFEYVRLLKEVKPRYFLLENVRMKKESQDIISGMLGVAPIMINSALVSAQNRVRLYWTNIPGVKQPEDRGIVFQDVVKGGYPANRCGRYAYNNGNGLSRIKQPNSTRFEVIQAVKNTHKSPTIRAGNGGYNPPMLSVINGLQLYNTIRNRFLTPNECEALQTIPDNYTYTGQSKRERYRQLGNGWTVAVVAHILSYMKLAEQKLSLKG